jgi:hypothetical protein
MTDEGRARRILICGDREWTDAMAIRDVLVRLHPDVVIEGEQRGADRLARLVAEGMGITVEPYPADWKTLGKPAGPIRNRRMLDEGRPDHVCAFHDDLPTSKGTADMVRIARRAGVPVTVCSHVVADWVDLLLPTARDEGEDET